jgi:hypothetical protein
MPSLLRYRVAQIPTNIEQEQKGTKPVEEGTPV